MEIPLETALGYASRGRNRWWRYLLTLIAASMLALVLLILAGLGLGALHLLPRDFAQRLQQPKDAASFFLGIGAVFGALALALAAAARLIQSKRPKDVIGLWRWRYFLLGLMVWAAVECGVTLIDFLIAPHGFAITASAGSAALAGTALIGLGIQTFAEEFIFRGYLTQGLLLAFKRPLPAAIVSGLLFGSLHIPNGGPQALVAAIFGIVCSLIAIRMGGIALTYGVHLVNNYFGAVAVVSTSDVFKGSPGLFVQNTPQLLWSDTAFTVLALFGLLWLVMHYRKFEPP